MTRLLLEDGWTGVNVWKHAYTQPGFAVIRHPVDRWFSGVKQYVYQTKHTDYETCLQTVLDGGWPVFDQHTIPQRDYLLSTVRFTELVRLDDLTEYMLRYGLELPQRPPSVWEADDRLIPLLTDFYADDIELYESTIRM
jgi:hypothetical protein